MRIDLLTRAAELLEADAANTTGVKFDLRTWATTQNGEAVSISCGTTACAVGLFILSGEFEKEGLSNRYAGNPDQQDMIVPYWVNPKDHHDYAYQFAAAARLFGIGEDESMRLFDSDRYSGKLTGAEAELEVAARIRELIATNT